jgi:teichuronic acid exporter
VHFRNKLILKGVVWSLADTFANFALKFFFALAITRLLTPRDYGLIAYMGLFLGIAAWLAEGGFGNALIQKKDPDEIDFSTGYFFNVVVSIIFFLLYFFSAAFVAGYFGEPELKNIMRVMSINLVLDSLCYIHLLKLIKYIRFKEQAVLNFFVSIISGTAALIMAIRGYGYWALVFQTLIGTVLKMGGLWFIVKWKPVIQFSWHSFREQFKFGSKVFIQGLIESVFREINSLVIGKSYQTAALGNYSRGQKFYDLFIVQTGVAVNKVLYPAMAKETDETAVHKNIYSRIYNLLFFVMAPVSMLLFLVAEPLIHVLLTEKWLAAVPFMKLFFLGGFIMALLYFNSSTVLSSNRPKLFLKMDIVHKILMGVALAITFSISIQAIIIGWLIVYYGYYIFYECIMYRINYYEKGKYSKMLQVIVCLLPLVFFYFISRYFIPNNLMLLLINIFLQPVLYLAVMKGCKFSVYKEYSVVAKNLLPRQLRFFI